MKVDGENVNVPTQVMRNDKSTMKADEPAGTNSGFHVSDIEEARLAIEMLRGDDSSARVTAANQLESIAAALGEERTREVR